MQSIQLQSLLAHKIKNSQKAKNLKLFELCNVHISGKGKRFDVKTEMRNTAY